MIIMQNADLRAVNIKPRSHPHINEYVIIASNEVNIIIRRNKL